MLLSDSTPLITSAIVVLSQQYFGQEWHKNGTRMAYYMSILLIETAGGGGWGSD